MASICFAEKLKIVVKPGGATCQHILVKDLSGDILLITDLSEILKPISRNDDILTIQLKFFIKQKGISNINTIKTELEKVDFDILDIKR